MSLSISKVCAVIVITLLIKAVSVEPGEFKAKSSIHKISRPQMIRGRVFCPKVTNYLESKKGSGCVSKYECKRECTLKKQCRTRYKYKCTDYNKRECKDVWQNQCNGKASRKRMLNRSNNERERSTQLQDHQALSRVRRLIETDKVYDQSYPVPPSDLPFTSKSEGQVFAFANPPQSRACWKKVRDCKWVKYRSSCRNEPIKTCDDKPSNVCSNKCKRIYSCKVCPSIKPDPKPPQPDLVGPPSIPLPGTFIISSPAPPAKLDVIVDVRRQRRIKGDKLTP